MCSVWRCLESCASLYQMETLWDYLGKRSGFAQCLVLVLHSTSTRLDIQHKQIDPKMEIAFEKQQQQNKKNDFSRLQF